MLTVFSICKTCIVYLIHAFLDKLSYVKTSLMNQQTQNYNFISKGEYLHVTGGPKSPLLERFYCILMYLAATEVCVSMILI